MKKVIPQMPRGYTNLLFPDFVGLYGKEHFDLSMQALKYFTSFGSSEFAIREYLRLDFDKAIKIMKDWASDKDHHVRRLASEGSRPRLPWSFKLDKVIEDPSVTFPILDRLKEDEELYVRKSVANHLNDISREHPDFVLDVVKKWKGRSKHTDWIIKHGSRTLLKKGNLKVLAHFGVKHNDAIKLEGFRVLTPKVKTGNRLKFEFRLKNSSEKKIKVRIEYAVYFLVANGSLSKKVFKISERDLPAKGILDFEKEHDFKRITTRKYYPGVQKISVIINGKESPQLKFELKA
jgi:3-methyladenine DNA glycosylase AlkC